LQRHPANPDHHCLGAVIGYYLESFYLACWPAGLIKPCNPFVFVGAAIATAGTGVIISKGVCTILMHLLILICKRSSPAPATKIFNRAQIALASYMAFSHGNNDAQKTTEIITILLVSYYNLPDSHGLLWVVVLCAPAMGLETVFGSWKIIKTLGV